MLWGRSAEQPLDLCHRLKQPIRLVWQPVKFMPFIERDCHIILGIHYDRQAGNLASQAPAERIEEQKCSEGFAALMRVDGQPAEKRSRQDGVAWELLDQCRRQLGRLDRGVRERVEADDGGRWRFQQDVRSGDTPPRILSCLGLQIAIQSFDTAGELRAVVPPRVEKLDDKLCGRTHDYCSPINAL